MTPETLPAGLALTPEEIEAAIEELDRKFVRQRELPIDVSNDLSNGKKP